MKNESTRSTSENETHSPAAMIWQQQTWFAALALILGILVGNSVTRQNVPALIVFALVVASVYGLHKKGYGSSLLIYSVMLVMLIATANPRLLAFFSNDGSYTLVGTTIGVVAALGLLATSLVTTACPSSAGGMVPAAAADLRSRPRRAITSVDLLLTTVSKIPTFVKRLSPLPRRQSPENLAGAPANAAEYMCRALPTPPQITPQIRRWPGAADRRRM